MADYAHEKTDKQLKQLEKRLTKEYRQAAKEVEQKMDGYLSAFTEKDEAKRQLLAAGKITEQEYKQWRTGQIMTGKRWTEMRDTLAQDLTNVDKIAMGMVRDELPEVYALNHNYGTYEAEKGSGISTSYTLYNKDTVNNLMQEDKSLLPQPKVDIPKDLRWNKNKISSAVAQGVLQGESIPKIAKRLQSVTDMDKKAAIRNARTAMTGAQNKGRIDSYDRARKMGINVQATWIAALDDRTRESHIDLDGQHPDEDGYFHTINGNKLRFPGDPLGQPEEVYNCRCTLIGEVDGSGYNISDATERNSKLGDMSYEEWKEGTEKPNDSADIMFKNVLPSSEVKDARAAAINSYAALPEKVQKEMSDVTYELGYAGSSCDLEKGIIQLAKNATKEEADHEMGHLVETRMVPKEKVVAYKKYLTENVKPDNIYSETYYNSSGEPMPVMIVHSDRLLTQYQGRIYVDTYEEAFDVEGNIRLDMMKETISEPFKIYMNNPELIGANDPARKIIEEIIL